MPHAASLKARTVPAAVGRHYASLRRLDAEGISFVENRGQTDDRVAFYARNGGKTLWLTRNELVFDVARMHRAARARGVEAARAAMGLAGGPGTAALDRVVFRERLVGADRKARLAADQPRPGVLNYFVGGNPARWRSGAKSYALVTYRNAWRGIDMRLYGLKGDLEQEFVVRPGADPGRVRFAFAGVRGLAIDRDGALLIHTALGDLRQGKPFAYQTVAGKRTPIAAHFRLAGRNRFSFRLASYDRRRPLVIDPPLLYATYLGGIHDDQGSAIAVDAEGNSYVAGFTASEDFPVSATAFQTTRAHLGVYVYNAFVTKFSPAGVIVYSTFVGGSGDKPGICGANFAGDCAEGIAVDTGGNAYVTGVTSSSDFPVTGATAFQPVFGGGSIDAFLFELSPDGSRLGYSTFLGGTANESASAIATADGGQVWIGGEVHATGTFPSTTGAFQRKIKGADNGFVARFDLTKVGAASLVWSTLLGGTSTQTYGGVLALTVDGKGRVYATGQTHSPDFPVTAATALQGTFNFSGGCLGAGNLPNSAAFVSKLSADGSQLLYSTFVGGETVGANLCDQYASAITLDAGGNIWILGETPTNNFPTTSNAYSRNFLGGPHSDLFLEEVSADGTTQLYGSYFGGSGDEFPSFGMAADPAGNVYFGGVSNSGSNYPTHDATQAYGGGNDAVVSEIAPGAGSTSVVFSTFLGGSGDDVTLGLALDAQGNIHVSGATDSGNFPVVNAIQTKYANGDVGPDHNDAFVAVFGAGIIGSVSPAVGGNFGSTTITITGAGFESGATVALASGGGTVASGQFVKVAADGASLRATFDLSQVAPGTYDVGVVNPDTTAFLAPGAFTVKTGGGAQLWVTLVGRSKIRVGVPSTFYLDYGNNGLNDAYMVRVWLQFPTASLDYQLGATLTQPQITGNPIDVSGTPIDIKLGDQTVLPLVIPVVPAGGSGSVPVIFTAPAVQSGIMLKTWVNPPGTSSIADVTSLTPQPPNSTSGTIGLWSMPQCYADMAQYAAEAFGLSTPQQCWGVFPQNSQGAAANAVASIMNGDASLNSFLMALTQFLDQQDKAVDQCLHRTAYLSPIWRTCLTRP